MHLLSFNKYFYIHFSDYMSQGQALWLPVTIAPRPQPVKPIQHPLVFTKISKHIIPVCGKKTKASRQKATGHMWNKKG